MMKSSSETLIHFDSKRRHDFVFLFDVTHGNPNGDPDSGNMPRIDPETMHGLVTDAAIKRKIRDYVVIASQDMSNSERYNIYVEHRGVLNSQHRKAYKALGLPLGEKGIARTKDKVAIENLSVLTLPDGFSFVTNEDAGELIYDGSLDQEQMESALAFFEREGDQQLARFADTAMRASRRMKLSRNQIDDARAWMCENFFDIRMFGAVMNTSINAGQVRGPMQLTFSESIDAITINESTLTRVAITREEDIDRKVTEMGKRFTVPYALYRGYGFYSPHLARGTNVSNQDLELFWSAMENMWDHSRTASRGLIHPRGLFIFSHQKALGNASAAKLFDLIQVRAKNYPAKRFDEYEVVAPSAGQLEKHPGVTLTVL